MSLEKYVVLFMIYSFLGWLMEVLVTFYHKKKFVDRGFLIGPYCPIYGYGCLLIIILLKNNLDDPVALFLKAILICSLLEYFTSYFMEKLFHARWWDYSHKKFNINGRICLETMLPFGILGCFVMYIINPFLEAKLDLLPSLALKILAILLVIIYLVDNVISFKIISSFGKTITKEAKDSTEEITSKVRDILKHKNILSRRLANAFPKFQTKIKKLNKNKDISK